VRAVVERTGIWGAKVILARHFAQGGRGAVDVAHEVVRLSASPGNFKFVYEESAPLWEKMRAIATRVLRCCRHQRHEQRARADQALQESGYGNYPVCVAKTQYSFSTDPTCAARLPGTSSTSAKCGSRPARQFVVMICGDIMTMPGLRACRPRTPSTWMRTARSSDSSSAARA